MSIPEFFKYGTLISIPLFSLIALLLVRKSPDYSFQTHTVSKSIYVLRHRTQRIIFRLNFILKGLLDLGFALYVLNYFRLPLESITFFSLLVSAILFGSLAYFTEGKHSLSHKIATYTGGVFLVIGQISLAGVIGDRNFLLFSIVFVSVPLVLAFLFLFTKRTNVVVQTVCMAIWYIWYIALVARYL